MLDNLETQATEGWNRPVTIGAAERLRTTMAAVRVAFTWSGVQRGLTADQKAQAARAFDAEGEFLSAGKKLLDTKHTAFRAVTAIRTRIGDYTNCLSLPFPEPGIRLIKLDAVEDFDRQMADYKAELDDAVANLDRHFDELKRAAARRLGSLFNVSDYPETLIGLFGVSFDFPLIEPPDYLVQLSPDLYAREQERVCARFDEAVRQAEQAFLEDFTRLVGHLTERITRTNEDGSQKVFRDSAVDNLWVFLERFRSLNVRSNQQHDELARLHAPVAGPPEAPAPQPRHASNGQTGGNGQADRTSAGRPRQRRPARRHDGQALSRPETEAAAAEAALSRKRTSELIILVPGLRPAVLLRPAHPPRPRSRSPAVLQPGQRGDSPLVRRARCRRRARGRLPDEEPVLPSLTRLTTDETC